MQRIVGAVTASGFITATAFWLLLTGRLDGGPFVSMLTLALATASLILLWERVAKIDFMGHKIELRDLARRAEKRIGELDESRAATLRTALAVTGKRSGGSADRDVGDEAGDERRDDADTLALLDHIDRAGLTPALADEVLKAADRVIEHSRARAVPALQSALAPRTGHESGDASGKGATREKASEGGSMAHEGAGGPSSTEQLARALYHRDRARACLSLTAGRATPDR